MMPYITQIRRDELSDEFSIRDTVNTPGELNYKLTELCQQYLMGEKSYGAFNAVIGALECCKLELYRRLIVPYEEEKIKENGDVYV